VLSIQTEGLISPDLVHVLWGTSRDFGANGLRLGVLISQANKDLLAACSACAIFSSPSSLAENAIGHILSDRQFLAAYAARNKERLSTAYTYATRLLSEHGVEYLPGATAGFFLRVNLGKSWQKKVAGDRRGFDNTVIFEALLQEKVFVVSGDSTGAEQPGWFRLVFSQDQEVVAEAINRIARML
jgi:aspartate/methionine/tyrosine aminotransferase